MNNNIDLKILAIVLKHLGLFMFGSVMCVGIFTILQHYGKTIENDAWFIISSSISWTIICFCNGYLEYKRFKN